MPANQNLRFVGCVGIDPAHFVLGVLNVLWLSLDSMVSHAEMCAGFIYCSVVFFFYHHQQGLVLIFGVRLKSNLYQQLNAENIRVER